MAGWIFLIRARRAIDPLERCHRPAVPLPNFHFTPSVYIPSPLAPTLQGIYASRLLLKEKLC